MLPQSLVFLVVFAGLQHALAAPSQVPLDIASVSKRPRRQLQGRFLHITDMHPDPYYQVGMSETTACHRKKPKKAKRRSGEYGMAYSDCDSPFALTNYTLDFLDKKWSSEIDFVIWTGDSARHDNDRKLPRTTREIYELNRAVASKMESVFLSKGIPVIPSIGNNDVWPHNIMMPGPNDVTFEFSSIWRSFIPFPSYQVFQRGGYYSVDVIPDAVAVISLNTMYFFDSNKAVGGCEPTDSEDPGNLEFDWLEVQLEMFRSRGMQVWISGHVPPSARNYFPECHVRYVELSLRFQDTILGHVFGHMNADHFFFVNAKDVTSSSRDRSSDDIDDEVRGQGRHKELFDTLLKTFVRIDKVSKKKLDHDNYAVVNVAPSVVPNPYLPSFRIFSYNISGTPYVPGLLGEAGGTETMRNTSGLADRLGDFASQETPCTEQTFQKSWMCRLNQPWNSSPHSPSRRNTLWSPLGYAQYYLPSLNETHLDFGKERPPKYKLEYLTYAPSLLHPPMPDGAVGFQYPIPLRHLPRSLRNSTVRKSKYAPYGMGDLTIPSWTKLAQQLAKPKREKLRRRFRQFMYMGVDER